MGSHLDAVPPAVWVLVSTVSLLLAVASLALMPRLIARLPADYVTAPAPTLRQRLARASGRQLALLLLRNLLGLVLIGLGLVMLFVPGQGLLTIVAGLALVDGPGRHRVLVALLRRPSVARAVQAVRRRHDVPPLVGLEPSEPPSG